MSPRAPVGWPADAPQPLGLLTPSGSWVALGQPYQAKPVGGRGGAQGASSRRVPCPPWDNWAGAGVGLRGTLSLLPATPHDRTPCFKDAARLCLGAWAPAGRGGASRQPPEQSAGAPRALAHPSPWTPMWAGRGGGWGTGCWPAATAALSGADAVGQPQGAGGDAGHRGRAPEDRPQGAPGRQGEGGRGPTHRR